MCICVYECENINAVHQAQTKYAVRKLLQRETYTAGAEFFSSPWMILVFYVYTFLIFIARGGVVDGVCVCVLCVVCCAPTTEGGKNCHSLRAERTYILLACRCLCATTNFIIILSGLFFHSFFVFFCFCMLHFSLLFLLDFHAIPYTLPYTTGQL